VGPKEVMRWREPSNPDRPPLSTEEVLAIVEKAGADDEAASFANVGVPSSGAAAAGTSGMPLKGIHVVTDGQMEASGGVECRPSSPRQQCRYGGVGHVTTELAIADSKAFAALREADAMERLRPYTRIWARTNPADKVLVLKMHMAAGLVCSMAGDGGNDCGALREAQAGLALSEAEASIVSPFTSNTGSIMSVVDLLREGRAALANSFGTFKWLIAYGMFFSILKLASFYMGVIVAAWAYILIDVSTLIVVGL